MFGRWRSVRAKDGADASRLARDRTVRTAERCVRHAWALELARRREREEFALRIERESYDNAIGHLIAAQRDGDPGQISVARTVALEAVAAVRAAVVARDQARRKLRRDRRLLTRRPLRLSAVVDDRGRARSRPSKLIGNPQRRRGFHLRRLVRWRAADLGRQWPA